MVNIYQYLFILPIYDQHQYNNFYIYLYHSSNFTMRNNYSKRQYEFDFSPKTPQSQVVRMIEDNKNYQERVSYTKREQNLRSIKTNQTNQNKSSLIISPQYKNYKRKSDNFPKKRAIQDYPNIKKVQEDNLRLVEERQSLFRKNCQLVNQINSLKKKSTNNFMKKKQMDQIQQQYQKSQSIQPKYYRVKNYYESIMTEGKQPNIYNYKFNSPTHQIKYQPGNLNTNIDINKYPKLRQKNQHKQIGTKSTLSTRNLQSGIVYNFFPSSHVKKNSNHRNNNFGVQCEQQIFMNQKTTPYPSNISSNKSSRLFQNLKCKNSPFYQSYESLVNKIQATKFQPHKLNYDVKGSQQHLYFKQINKGSLLRNQIKGQNRETLEDKIARIKSENLKLKEQIFY